MVSLKELVRERCVKRGRFELSSGEVSDVYVDVKRGYTDPGVLSRIASEASRHVGDAAAVAGTALGGVPIATAVSLETGLPLLVVRKERKDYGTSKRVEGPLRDGMRVVVTEDVTTTGGSLLSAVKALRQEGAVVDRTVTVVDREAGAVEALAAEDVTLIPLVKLGELIGGDNG